MAEIQPVDEREPEDEIPPVYTTINGISCRMKGMESGARRGLKSLRFLHSIKVGKEEEEWRKIKERFYKHATHGKLLIKANFGICLGMKNEEGDREFAARLFDTLARRRNFRTENGITIGAMRVFFEDMTNQDQDTRLQIFFEMCDKNADGNLCEDEIKEVLLMSASANRLWKFKENAAEYASEIMEILDQDQKGYIEIWKLEVLLRDIFGSGEEKQRLEKTDDLAGAVVPKESRNPECRFLAKSRDILHDNWRRIWILVLWQCINILLFTWKFFQYKHRSAFKVMGYCVCIAKGAAEILKFNMALILFPVCRITLTKMRETFLGTIIPVDDNIDFHKLIALEIAFAALIHTVMHLGCDFVRIASCPRKQFEAILGPAFHHRQPSYIGLLGTIVGVTGILMILLMSFAFILALHWFRKNVIKLPKPFDRLAGFNAFWYVHHLLGFVYVLLIIHGNFNNLTKEWYKKTTWMYIAIPMLVYASERILTRYEHNYKVKIDKAVFYPPNVIALYMNRPEKFKYKSGMYMFVKCPDISRFEWHPFSMTSAPEDADLSVHISKQGDWTGELIQKFKKVCESQSAEPSLGNLEGMETNVNPETQMKEYPRILIKGPYGAPAQDYKKYDIILLIGQGIGATPFISILKDILYTESQRVRTDDESGNKKGPKQVYFYWITRERDSLDWFKGVMDDIAKDDHNNIIEMHNHLTCIHGEGDARSALISLVRSMRQAKTGIDIVGESRVRVHFGRPNWGKEFKQLKTKHPTSKIGVFYCGVQKLGNEVKKQCEDSNSSPDSDLSNRFEFHKEHF